jgi:hypothetical protein
MISFLATMVHGVSAVSEFVGPDQVVLKAGTATSTDTALMTSNDSHYMEYKSNKSGDKNYYEAYKIESDSDITKYFNVSYPHYYMPVEYKAEKTDSSYVSHKKVIRIQDKYSYYWDQFGFYFNQYLLQGKPVHNSSALGVGNGSLEFYFLSEATNGTFMMTFGDSKYARFHNTTSSYMEGNNYGISFGITPIGGAASKFFWQTYWTGPLTVINPSLVQYQPNKWYHVKLAFNFNHSWAIRINNAEVYNSTTWTINSTLRMFNTVSMMTVIRTAYSGHESHVFYIDAMGLSYSLASHNSAVPTMQFNADYQPYVDINSHNNLNDHVANAALAAYFIFRFGDLLNKTSSAKFYLKGRYTSLLSSGMIKLYNHISKTYDDFANYTSYIEYPSEVFTLEENKNGSTIINATRYVDDAGTFSMKLEAQSTNNFNFMVDYMVVEFVLLADMGQVLIIIFAVLGVVAVLIVYKITQKGAPRARAGARKARRNLR